MPVYQTYWLKCAASWLVSNTVATPAFRRYAAEHAVQSDLSQGSQIRCDRAWFFWFLNHRTVCSVFSCTVSAYHLIIKPFVTEDRFLLQVPHYVCHRTCGETLGAFLHNSWHWFLSLELDKKKKTTQQNRYSVILFLKNKVWRVLHHLSASELPSIA